MSDSIVFREIVSLVKIKTMKKEYATKEITVVWKPEKCEHAGICVKILPNVYRPKDKPWINPENATTKELKEQIMKCPSGALTYYINKKED